MDRGRTPNGNASGMVLGPDHRTHCSCTRNFQTYIRKLDGEEKAMKSIKEFVDEMKKRQYPWPEDFVRAIRNEAFDAAVEAIEKEQGEYPTGAKPFDILDNTIKAIEELKKEKE
jgi:sugar-specific transcriptional regulator TrmB